MEVFCLVFGPMLTSQPCSNTLCFDVPTSSLIFIENVFYYTCSIAFFELWIIVNIYSSRNTCAIIYELIIILFHFS